MVDYSLALQAALRQFRAGRLRRSDVCDAHPDLIRAANYSGEKTDDPCPICSGGNMRLVSYAFSKELNEKNGRLWPRGDLARLLKMTDARLYTIEVCPDCLWNHLRSQLALGRGAEETNRKASR